MTDFQTEVWGNVPGISALQCSNRGRVRTVGRLSKNGRFLPGRTLKNFPASRGYYRVSTCRDGIRSSQLVHVLMLETFVGPRPEGMFGCHNDGNKLNNQLGNLRWDTPAGNSADSRRHGTLAEGTRNGRAKLTEWQVVLIRASLAAGVSAYDLSDLLGLSHTQIRKIAAGQFWRSVPYGLGQ